MGKNSTYRRIALTLLLAVSIWGCKPAQSETAMPAEPTHSETAVPILASTATPMVTSAPAAPTPDMTVYAFPAAVDPARKYLFYLHGKIIEDQGMPAISAVYGEYEYGGILEKLSGYGFVVISEQRSKDTDPVGYAQRVSGQVRDLLAAGVPAKNITLVGASKGAGIVIQISHFLEDEQINYVLLAICAAENVEEYIQKGIFLHGNVLSIYDSVDEYGSSCQDLFTYSDGKGIGRYDELVLNIGTGHGILYQPLDAWITPVVEWAGKP